MTPTMLSSCLMYKPQIYIHSLTQRNFSFLQTMSVSRTHERMW